MEIVVTGSNGFIGRAITKKLKELGFKVIELDLPNFDLRYCSLPIADAYIHLAANMGGIGFFSSEQFNPILDNMMIDSRIIDHCRKNKIKLLYASSACAYSMEAMNSGLELSEEMLAAPYDPDQMYGFEKLFVTKLAEHADFDFRVCVFHTIYGENQAYLGQRAKFIPQICYKYLTQEVVDVWGDGEQTRTFLYIEDAVEMILEVFFAKNYYGAVNISGQNEVSVNDVIKILAESIGKKKIVYQLDKPVGPKRRRADLTKFFKHYKSREKFSLEQGIEKVIKYINLELEATK